MVFVCRLHLLNLDVHTGCSSSEAGQDVIPRTAQKWMKSFLAVVKVR